jgi:hypothetical protein
MIIEIYNKHKIIDFITLFKTKYYDVKLTDFIFQYNNKEYHFIETYKRNYGKWFIFKKDNNLYATDYVFEYTNSKYDDYEFYISCDEKEFNDDYRNLDNMIILNSINLLDDQQKNTIIEQCIKAIDKYNRQIFINDNMIELLYVADDSNEHIISFKTYPDYDNNKKQLFEIYYYYDSIITDNEKEAFIELFDMLENCCQTREFDEDSNRFFNYSNIYYTSLITEEKFITKYILDYSKKSKIVFCKSSDYNKFINSMENHKLYNIDLKKNYNPDFDKDFLSYISYGNSKKDSHKDDIYIFTKDIYKLYKNKYRFEKL